VKPSDISEPIQTSSNSTRCYSCTSVEKRLSQKLISETIKKVKFSMREEKMKPKCNKKKQDRDGERPTFVTRYSSIAGRIV